MYNSMYLDVNTPYAHGLQNGVQFDIRLYFCRRGSENMQAIMTKDTFVAIGIAYKIQIKDGVILPKIKNPKD